MAADKREVELLIRAREVGSRNFQTTAKAVRDITAALDDQIAAAERGEGSVKELEASYKNLKDAGEALIRQQSLIDLYSKISAQLGEAKEKANAAATAHDNYKKSLEGNESVTRAQTRELNSLAKASDGAQRKVDALAASQQAQGERLEQAGIGVAELAMTQERLVTTAREVGAALTATGTVIDGFDQRVAKLVTTQERLAADDAFNRQLVEARKLRDASSYINFWTKALEEADVAQKKASELTSFQKLGDDALASSGKLNDFADRAAATANQTSRLGASLQGIIDPSGRARTTLSGLEAEVARVSAEVGAGDKPIRDYQRAINDLGAAQSAILKQAGMIDAYRDQEVAVEAAGAAAADYQAELVRVANAVKTAKAPNEQLAAALKKAETNANGATAAYQREIQKLNQLRGPLDAAEININDLAAAENRLRVASEATAVSVGRLDKVMSGKGSKAGAFLGLRPYELQNLSYQINDVFTQLASGTSVTQTLAQQGGQFFQLFPRAFGAIAAFLPEIVAVGAALYVVYSAIKRVFDLKGEVKEFSAALTATADAARYNAEELAGLSREMQDTGVKAKDAKGALKALIKEGIDPARIEAFTETARDMSKVLGIEIPDAAAKLGAAFTGGYEEVAKLDDELNFLTATEREHIRTMFDSGKAMEARTAAFTALQRRMDSAADMAEGRWAKAFRGLGIIWNNFLDALANAPIITNIVDMLGLMADAADRVGTALEGAGQRASSPMGNRLQWQSGVNGLPSNAGNFLATPVVTDEIKDIVRTVILEARRGDQQGWKDVTSVILNRMERSGQTGSQVVRAPGQFEPWMTEEGRKRLASIDENSAEFVRVLQTIAPLLAGREQSTVGGAVNFFSPSGQAAHPEREQRPRWARPPFALEANRGGHEFWRGSFPGDRRGGATPAPPSQAELKAGEEFIRQLEEEIKLNQKLSDEERIRMAGVRALRDAQSAGADPASQKRAQQLAQEEEARKVAVERAQQQQAIASDLASSLDAAASAQDRSLKQRIDAITAQYDVLIAKLKAARAAGLKEVNGQSLDQVEAQLRQNAEILKQKETMKFYEEQLASLERQRVDALQDVQNRMAAGTLTASDAAAKVAEINSKLLPQMEALTGEALAFATALNNAAPSPALEAFIARFSTATTDAAAATNKFMLKQYEDALSQLLQARDAQLAGITQRLQDGSLSAVDALKEAKAVEEQFAPLIGAMAADAKAFAVAINSATPSPVLQAFIAKMDQAAASATRTNAPTQPSAQVGNVGLAMEEQKLNEIIARRNELVATYIRMVQLGAMTEADARAKTLEAYQTAEPLIAAQADKVREIVELLRQQGYMTQQAYDLWIAKMQEVNVEAQYVDENFLKIKDSIVSGLSNAAISSIQMVVDAVAAAASGTAEWADVLDALGAAALNFFASFLKSISDVIIQMLVLQAIKSIPFLDSLAGGIGDAAGLIAGSTALGTSSAVLAGATAGLTTGSTILSTGATLLATGSASLVAGSATMTTGAVTLTAAAGVWAVVAAAIQAAADALLVAASVELAANSIGLFHGGGIAGSPGVTRSGVSPLAFVGAPRYHSGSPGIGLRANEQAAILKKGEEVLTEDNPRHIKNQIAGAQGNGSKASDVFVRVINALDAGDMVSKGLATPAGEKAILNIVSQNPNAFARAMAS